MSKFVLPVITLVLLATYIAWDQSAGGVKIGVIDSQKLVAESEAGKSSAAVLQEFVQQRNDAVEASRKELIALAGEMERLKRDTPEWSQKEEGLERKKNELAQAIQTSRLEVQEKDRELTQQILPDAREAVRELGISQGYTLILDANTGQVVFASDNVELTSKAIAELNKRSKK